MYVSWFEYKVVLYRTSKCIMNIIWFEYGVSLKKSYMNMKLFLVMDN